MGQRAEIDATRGLRDWSDDLYALLQALKIERPVHIAGWSTGGGAVTTFLMDHPTSVASVTVIDPVSPFGYGGSKPDGTPCFPDWAGSGGGTGNAELKQRIKDGDTTAESRMSPINVLKLYWSHTKYEAPQSYLDMLVKEILLTHVDDGGWPGDSVATPNWPGMAPGTKGLLNALSGKYCNWSGIVDVLPADKPPILWTHGTADMVVSDCAMTEMGGLGKLGIIPGWPGEEVFPPQKMVTQTRDVLQKYAAAGGAFIEKAFEGSGHGPHIDDAEQWSQLFFSFVQEAEEKKQKK